MVGISKCAQYFEVGIPAPPKIKGKLIHMKFGMEKRTLKRTVLSRMSYE